MYTVVVYLSGFFSKSSGGDWYIEDESGKQLPALIVFSESLKYLKQSLLEEAKKQQTDIEIDDIKWILTVPAIWSDPAKAFMRMAAVEVIRLIYRDTKESNKDYVNLPKDNYISFVILCVIILNFISLMIIFTGWNRL